MDIIDILLTANGLLSIWVCFNVAVLCVISSIAVLPEWLKRLSGGNRTVSPGDTELPAQKHPVMIAATGEKWECFVWNGECERITGFSRDEIVGRSDALENYCPTSTIAGL
jgi:hypothetical protein